MVAAAGAVHRDRDIVRAGGRMLAAHLLATAIKALVKRSVDRTRPDLLVDQGRYEVGKGRRNEGPFNSFPSGHTAGATAVACALVRAYPETAPYAYAAAGTIAVAQIPNCNHFASDIAAGAVIGWVAEAAVSRSAREGRALPSAGRTCANGDSLAAVADCGARRCR